MENDLRGDVRIIGRTLPYPHFVLKGEKLEYRVRQWDVDGLQTWELGYCENLEFMPRANPDDQYFGFGGRKLEVILYPEVRRNRQRLRDRAASWDRIFAVRRRRAQLDAHLREVHEFFRITQQLATVLTAAQVCPVRILEMQRTVSETEITLTPREENERNELARYLKLSAPSEQLRDWFDLGAEVVAVDDEEDPKRDKYQLLDRRIITTEPAINISWRFVSANNHRDGPRYKFRCQGAVPVRQGPSYLVRNFGGTIRQIRRQHKAIEDMRTHEDLLRLLADPRGTSRIVSDKLPPERTHVALDPSKIRALERLWGTQPFFALQGPPGTGKTTLIKSLGDRLLAHDATAQILITAHSHHTVDDVLHKLQEQFADIPAEKRPILIRIGARDPTEHDVGPVTQRILHSLRESSLAAKAPDHLRDRLLRAQSDVGIRDEAANTDVRTMQLLVQDSANVTFSTCNAGELADLGSRGRRFDWSVIEEAGKAHGFDMAAALQASHRLLLIGDHFQLPPFNASLFKELLGDPLRVRKAIQIGVQFAPGLIDLTLVDDDDDRAPFEERCNRWRRMVDLFAVLFRSSILTDDLNVGPAATLTDQHRMHPDIASVVGKVFYQDENGDTILKSPGETHRKFAKEPPYKLVEESWLADQRIVWRDVPWVQKKEYSTGESVGLFTSPVEALAVVEVLEQFRARDNDPCEIQIFRRTMINWH